VCKEVFIQGSEVLKPAPKITKELCHIDWSDITKNIYNLIRGLSPYPGAFTEIVKEGKEPLQMKIFASEKVLGDDFRCHEGKSRSHQCSFLGKYFQIARHFIAVATADGAISIKELQLSGKKTHGCQGLPCRVPRACQLFYDSGYI
jgi:methionyl-tRNA formyltransferase